MKSKKYIGLVAILLLFGYLFIPKIIDRVQKDATVASSRSVKPGYTALDFIRLNGEAKKVPDFLLLNQDSLYTSNEDYLGKVYVAEFFFSRCPTICPIMNKNMKVLYDRFGDREDFGIAFFYHRPRT